MLHVNNLVKYYGDAPVLQDASCTVGHGEHVGIVGPNGSGKSTLLRIIAGLEEPDAGSILVAPGASIGLLRQGYLGDEQQPAAAVLRPHGAAWEAHAGMQAAAMALAAEATSAEALDRYNAAATHFEELGGYTRLGAVEEVLRGLDLTEIDPARPVATLSGGQKTRLALGGLLLGRPDLLLLDEPTNHLDVDALRWLEEFVNRYPASVVIVSHDRAFLDATVTAVLELDSVVHGITRYAGGYADYAAAKEAQREEQRNAYRRQERERARIAADIRRTREFARGVEAKTQLDYRGQTRGAKAAARTRAAKVARKAKVREAKLEKALGTETAAQKPITGWSVKLDFAPRAGGAREVLRAEGVRMCFNQRTVLGGVDLCVGHGERVVLTGPNGGGKSTLLKIAAGALTPDAGAVRIGSGVVVGYFGQEKEGLDPRRTALETIRDAAPMTETEARALLHAYLFAGDDVFTPVGRLSFGERARLVLARLIISGANLLLLDEPTNHLDIPSRERFEQALAGFEGTMLAVLHDRYTIDRLATRVLELRDGRLRDIEVM